jgi:hypothetical protein
MADLIFPQDNTFGGLWTGLDATPTGSDAAFDVVADFTGSTETLFTAPSDDTPVVATHSQTQGSTFKISQEGLWVVSLTVQHATASSLIAAIGIDNVAGELNADPPVENSRILRRGLSISAGADTVPVALTSAPFGVTDNMAKSASLGLVRVLLSNAAGAGAPAATLAPLAAAALRITRIGSLPTRIRQGLH